MSRISLPKPRLVQGSFEGARVSQVRLVETNDFLEWCDEDGPPAVTRHDRLALAAVTALDLGRAWGGSPWAHRRADEVSARASG
jgi:hypothetical protein